MALPKKYYHRVETLFKINADYSVENLIHYAATNRLEMCVKINDVSMIENFWIAIDPSFQERVNKKNIAMGTYQNELGYIKATVKKTEESILTVNSNIILTDINYVFAIVDNSLSKNELNLINGEAVNIKNLNLPREYRLIDYGKEITPMVITMNDDFLIDTSNLVITDIELEKLNNGGELIKSQNDNENLVIHPTAERHAINREQILSAALRLIEEQPNVFNDNCRKKDGSINYSAFARELLERHHFFPNGEPPIKTQESISGILSNAYKSPNKK